MAFSRRSHPVRTQSRRKTSWDIGVSAQDLTIGGSTGKIWNFGAEVFADGLTLVRTRGYISVVMDASGGDVFGDGFFGAHGIGVTTVEAFAVGQMAIPDPFQNPEWDGWLWHQYWDVRETGGDSAGAVLSRFEVDSKAMRKLAEGMVIFGATGQSPTGTVSAVLNGETRSLLKLP